MQFLLSFLVVLVFASIGATQVIIDDAAPATTVQVEKFAQTRLTMLNPVPGKVIPDSVLHVQGVVVNASAGTVRLKLGTREQFASVDQHGRFSAVLPLLTLGRNALTIEAGGTKRVIDVIYRPALASLSVKAPPKTLAPGEAVLLEPLAQLQQHGAKKPLSPTEVTWQSSNPAVGRVDARGQFVAVHPGETVISAVFGGSTAQIPVRVASPVPPALLAGLSNVTVHTPHVLLKIWDHAEEDGDVVSVFFNGKPAIEFLEIFNTPRVFQLTLEPGHNLLEIQAENEGREPPNTAAISVESADGKGITQIFTANQHTRGHFTITLKQ